MPNRHAPLVLSALAITACADPGCDSPDELPIACRLDAMSDADRARERVLLSEHLASFVEARERDDGYSYRYPPSPALFVRLAELVSIEHRCCPFLRFELEWSTGDAPPWLHIAGGERVKPFIASTFGTTPDPSSERSDLDR